MSLPNISVVIPAYRAEATISRTLRHLLHQPIERIIVVVDGALDRTEAIAAETGDPRIEIVALPHTTGAQHARNLGLSLVATEAVMFHDADDYVEGNIMAGLAEVLAGADVAFAPMAIERGGKRGAIFMPDYCSAADLFQRWLVDRAYVIPAATLWRTAFVRTIGGWDEAIEKNQDGELAMRAALDGARIATSGRGLAIYVREGGDSISRRPNRADALLRASEKLLTMQTAIVDETSKRAAVARHTYGTAWDCFERGETTLGRVALARARELGFAGHRGPLHHQIAGHLLGLERKTQWLRTAKRLLRRSRP